MKGHLGSYTKEKPLTLKENSLETTSTSSFCKREVSCYQADRQGKTRANGWPGTSPTLSLTHPHNRRVIQEAQGFFDGLYMLPRPGDSDR